MYCLFLFAYSIRDHKNKNISSINLFLYEYYNIGDSVVIFDVAHKFNISWHHFYSVFLMP